MDITKFFKFLIQHLWWQLSSQLVCLFFDFVPPCAFDFDQKLPQNIAQIIIYYRVIKKICSLLEFIDHLLSILECFGKTLVAFNFDEKLTQGVAQLTN